MTTKPQIDPFLFEQQFAAFKHFVGKRSQVKFSTFASHPYTQEKEGYKYHVHALAHGALSFQSWDKKDIGSGKIITAVIQSIEIPESNLVPWQARYGEDARPHQPLYKAAENIETREAIESCFYDFYFGSNDVESFDAFIGIFGKKYPLIAYFFFVKDRSKYCPIAPTFFDKAFDILGADFQTSHKCSWDNYSTFIGILKELKDMLSDRMSAEVTLLDAHSFAWILSSQMQKEDMLADVKEYLNLSVTERDAVVKARVGQGQFRSKLIDYWSSCAVTGCANPALLRASHIKPWADSDLEERLSLYNGLLLSPALDLCFDSGLVSFEDSGELIVSPQLSPADMNALGIGGGMRLAKLEPGHIEYLAYHRENILRKGPAENSA